MLHYVFGSKSSRDYDILAVVPALGNIEECKQQCLTLEPFFKFHYQDKPLNLNLGVIENGILVKVHKGTADEVNNSICDTYNLHNQQHDLILTHIKRDVDLKIVRAVRILIGFLSRTQYRSEVKEALYSNDIDKRLALLEKIDLRTIENYRKKESVKDIFKTMAFQIGQTWCLMKDKEVYTKEDIEDYFPILGPLLKRESEDANLMNTWKNYFVYDVKEYRPKMKVITEEFKP